MNTGFKKWMKRLNKLEVEGSLFKEMFKQVFG